MSADGRDFVTVTVGGQLCGIPIGCVREVMTTPAIAGIPLAPPEIAGSLNLRGRIVTAIDLRRRIGLDAPAQARMPSIVVEGDGALYSLIVDGVGEVLHLPESDRDALPPALSPRLREVAQAVFRLRDGLLVALDVPAILSMGRSA